MRKLRSLLLLLFGALLSMVLLPGPSTAFARPVVYHPIFLLLLSLPTFMPYLGIILATIAASSAKQPKKGFLFNRPAHFACALLNLCSGPPFIFLGVFWLGILLTSKFWGKGGKRPLVLIAGVTGAFLWSLFSFF